MTELTKKNHQTSVLSFLVYFTPDSQYLSPPRPLHTLSSQCLQPSWSQALWLQRIFTFDSHKNSSVP